VHDKENGILLDDLAEAFISLGLAIDLNFVKRILRVLAPSKFFNHSNFSSKQLSMKEFTKIF